MQLLSNFVVFTVFHISEIHCAGFTLVALPEILESVQSDGTGCHVNHHTSYMGLASRFFKSGLCKPDLHGTHRLFNFIIVQNHSITKFSEDLNRIIKCNNMFNCSTVSNAGISDNSSASIHTHILADYSFSFKDPRHFFHFLLYCAEGHRSDKESIQGAK